MPRAIHWQRILKYIRNAEPFGIAISDVAKKLSTDKTDEALLLGIEYLHKSNKIKKVMGLDSDKTVTICLFLKDTNGESTRKFR